MAFKQVGFKLCFQFSYRLGDCGLRQENQWCRFADTSASGYFHEYPQVSQVGHGELHGPS
jgi:hypothetical protein